MAAPLGRREGFPIGNRDRAFGRLGATRGTSTWTYNARFDPTVSVLDDRAALSVPRGEDLSKILPSEEVKVMRSSAGSWPRRLPQSASQEAEDEAWAEVRATHTQLYGLPAVGAQAHLEGVPSGAAQETQRPSTGPSVDSGPAVDVGSEVLGGARVATEAASNEVEAAAGVQVVRLT